MNHKDDQEILELIGRDQTMDLGYRYLLEKYQQKLYWQVRRMVMNHEDANDVVQDCFIKIYRNISKFKGNSSLYTWVFRIASNEAISFLRKEKRRKVDELEDHGELAQNLRQDAFFDESQAMAKLYQAMAELPEKQRQVFSLRYFEEMPYKEMSEKLETSVGALKASFHHAMKKMERSLREE